MNKEDVQKLYTTSQYRKTLTTKEYFDKYVDYNVTLSACRECPNYSTNWACPEFTEDVMKYWTDYENIDLILTKINFTDTALETSYENISDIQFIVDNSLFYERNSLFKQLLEEEKKINGRVLSVGMCGECERCARLDDKACIKPEKCRNSIESIGGLVTETLRYVFDEELKWIDMEHGKLPVNLSLLMGLLY